jgi:tetratricopeptide (TPR) repeat protein
VLLALMGSPPAARAQARVPTEDAMKQLIKRVDPIVPPEAVAQKVGGPVVADIIVSPKGTVESVRILAGPPLLHPAAIAAFKQWVFKPFIRNSKPMPALVMVEVAFPDPIRAEALRAERDRAAARNACERDLESSPQTAVRSCAEWARVADGLPASERSGALASYGQSLYRQGRLPEALVQFERALAARLTRPSPGDADIAALYAVIGMLHDQLGQLTQADEAFTKAVQEYERAIAQVPEFAERYRRTLKITLEQQAAVKRRLGQTAAAGGLEARSAALPTPPSARPRTPPPVKTIGSIVCVGESAVRLTEDDVTQIRKKLPAGAAPWVILDDSEGPQKAAFVKVYLQPSTDQPAVRRGGVAFATSTTGRWDVTPAANIEYVQIPPTSREPLVAWGRIQDRPFEVAYPSQAAPMSNTELIDLVTFLRRTAASTPPTQAGSRPRFFTDLQPWPIGSMMGEPKEGLRVFLVHPDSPDGGTQIALLRRTAGAWAIVELSGG